MELQLFNEMALELVTNKQAKKKKASLLGWEGIKEHLEFCDFTTLYAAIALLESIVSGGSM